MPGLTAKVFRTYNASFTLQEELDKINLKNPSRTPFVVTILFLIIERCAFYNPFSSRKSSRLQPSKQSRCNFMQSPASRTEGSFFCIYLLFIIIIIFKGFEVQMEKIRSKIKVWKAERKELEKELEEAKTLNKVVLLI
jgi:uncharacterized membrane protein